MIAKEDILELLKSTGSYRVERTVSTGNMDKFCEAICAFANDMPGFRKNGYLIIGAKDNGSIAGMKVDDALLKRIVGILYKMYSEGAIRELLMNACMHRDYQANMPIRLYQFDDYIEVMNAGGLYGEARPENFPSVNDYRNPLVAEAMRVMKYVNKFNRGVTRVQEMLKDNGNVPAEFDVNTITAFRVNVHATNESDLSKDTSQGTSQGKVRQTKPSKRKSSSSARSLAH